MRTVIALALLYVVTVVSGCDRHAPTDSAAAAPDATAPDGGAVGGGAPAESSHVGLPADAARPPQAPPSRALRAYANAETGAWTLRLARTAVTQSSEFRLSELWRYGHDRKEWSKTGFQASATVVPPAEGDRAYTILVPLDLSKAVPPRSVGLYFVKWTLDGNLHTGLLYVANRYPDDYEIGPTPPGMIKAPVPLADSALATFVPDPETHCTSPAN